MALPGTYGDGGGLGDQGGVYSSNTLETALTAPSPTASAIFTLRGRTAMPVMFEMADSTGIGPSSAFFLLVHS